MTAMAAQQSGTIAAAAPSVTNSVPPTVAAPSSPASTPIALTTIFTPPASCLSTITYDGTSFWQGGVRQLGDHGCYPPSFTAIYNSFYSPGICPHSWTSVGTNDGNDVKATNGLPLTNAMCCPKNYYLSTGTTGVLHFVCATLFSTDLTNVYSTSTLQNGSQPTNAPLITVRAADIAQNTIYADVIQVVWQSTDSQILRLLTATSRASPSATATPGSIIPTTSTVSPTPQPIPPTPTRTGLSLAAVIAIAISTALAILALVFAAFLFRRYRRRQRPKPASASEQETQQQQSPPPPPHEVPEFGRRDFPPPPRGEVTFFAELPGSDPSNEMDSPGSVVREKKIYEADSLPTSPEERKSIRGLEP